MIEIDLRIDHRKFDKFFDSFSRQVPYVAALTINRSMLDIQRYLRDVTYRKAWTNRNKALPKALTTFRGADRARKGKYYAKMGPAMGRNGHLAGEGFTGRQRTGQTRLPKKQHISIPKIGPGLRRGAAGAIPKAKRPSANRKLFTIKARGGSELLVERQRKKLVVRYFQAPKARGTRRLSRFESDVHKVANRVVREHFRDAAFHAIATARR